MEATLTEIKTRAGVGHSQNENSFEAGVEIANRAVNGTELLEETLFLLFATPHHEIDLIMDGVRSVLGNNPKFLGCTTTGLVTNDFLSYSGALAGGAFLSCDKPFFKIYTDCNIKDEEFDAGKRLAKQYKEDNTPDDASILLFYDSVKVTSTEGQPVLSVATTILSGFHSVYEKWLTVAGMGAMGEINLMYPCAAWADQTAGRHVLAGASILNPIKMDTIIMHGTKPVGAYHTITKARDNIVYEIDDKPALDVIYDLLGGSVDWEEFPLLVTLGVNTGDKFGEYKEENYAGRLCLAVDKESRALIMFENDLVEGSET